MKYVIIGGSAAGISAVEAIRTVDKEGKITLISDEKIPLYSRCLLTYYLAGRIPLAKLKFRKDDFYEENKVEAIHGVRARKVLPQEKKVVLEEGKGISYDKLLIATGARAQMVEAEGSDKGGIFALRTHEDAVSINAMLERVKNVAILGGGLIGLRAAYALSLRGKKVRVIVKSDQVLSQILDKRGAYFIQRRIQEKGIEVMTGLSVVEFLGGKTVDGLVLDNGRRLPCELVIVGKGVKPDTGLTEGTGIETDYGIIVNEYMETNYPDIYAAGDVAQARDIVTEQSAINALWPCAVSQGKVAGLNMAGKKIVYGGSLAMNSVEFFGLPVISMGITRPKNRDYEEIVKEDERNLMYKKVVLKDNRVKGMIFLNKIEQAGLIRMLMLKKIDVSPVRGMLLEDNFDFAKIVPLIRRQEEMFPEQEYQESIISY